jgi:PAS domain S-box-containing protein
VKENLARAFGLGSKAEVEALIEKLRSGAEVDAQILRKGCLALIDEHIEVDSRPARSDPHLQAALSASKLGLWDWDVSTGEIFVQRNILQFLGRDTAGKSISIQDIVELVHEDDRENFAVATRAALRGETQIFHVSHRARHADGRWVWVDTYGCVTERDAAGRVLRMTGTHTDITARKQIERALSNTLRVMKALLETLPLPVILRDAERRVTLVNAAWEQMVGVTREQAVGKPLTTGPGPDAPQGHHETDDQVFETRKPLRYETSVRGTNNKPVNVLIAKTPLLAEDGTLTGIASVLTDISEQKNAEALLEKARLSAEAAVQAKSRFLANMSHELRTPLNGVVGMASLLENTALDSKQRRFVRTLRSSAEALMTLINDVLDLSKAEAGKLELSVAPFELRRELEQVAGLFSARAYDKGIEIAAHIDSNVPAIIQGDPLRLRQVLGNLVNNAVKFTDSGAVLISVKVAATPEHLLEFSVTDTGVGVAPDEQKRIFDAFEQADGSVTRKFGGTGLGLAISRQLVELMRGHMALHSEPGFGSRFSFVIPAGVSRAEPRTPTPPPDLGVLVIGMHPVIRGAVCDTISGQTTHVISVDSPKDAIEALRDFRARISRVRVILDSGATSHLEQTVSSLRAAAPRRQVEVIALMPPDADAAPPPGVNRVLVKPLCTPDLIASTAAPDSAAHSARVRVLPPTGSRGRALVVEDNAVNQEMARAMLDMLGFEVVTASNGRDGVTAAAADPQLALILMDCQMPIMDGLAAARAIRAAEATDRRTPIIALTGNAMPGDREACVAAGMDDYLAKPFSLTALRTTIDRWAPAGSAQVAVAGSSRRARPD